MHVIDLLVEHHGPIISQVNRMSVRLLIGGQPIQIPVGVQNTDPVREYSSALKNANVLLSAETSE